MRFSKPLKFSEFGLNIITKGKAFFFQLLWCTLQNKGIIKMKLYFTIDTLVPIVITQAGIFQVGMG